MTPDALYAALDCENADVVKVITYPRCPKCGQEVPVAYDRQTPEGEPAPHKCPEPIKKGVTIWAA